jgi:hypothetical protein
VNAQSELPSADDFERLEGELFDRIAVRHRRQVLRHRLVAAAAILVVAGAGVAAGTIANSTQQSKFANCYEGSSTNSREAQVAFPTNRGYATKPATTASPQQISNALFLCQGLWRIGAFSTSSGAGTFPVPKLQVCLRDDLIVSVFRKTNANESADEFCNRLGLSAP